MYANYIPVESTGDKVAYRRYASLFFVVGISASDNELITLEIIHRYVEVLDRYFGNVSLPIIFIFVWVHLGGDLAASEQFRAEKLARRPFPSLLPSFADSRPSGPLLYLLYIK